MSDDPRNDEPTDGDRDPDRTPSTDAGHHEQGSEQLSPMADKSFDDAVSDLRSSLDVWAAMTKRALERASAGTYTADALTADITTMWRLAVAGGRTALRLALDLGPTFPTQYGQGTDTSPSAGDLPG